MGEKSAPKFKIGDIVRLKSGGPDMIVVDRGALSFLMPPGVPCWWFSKRHGKVHRDSFPEELLVLAKSDER
jgi:uncharacterized protein YodC (DUF2158 family)